METLKFLLTSSFFPPYCIGGDAFAVKYLADALARKGHEVGVMHSLDAFALKAKNRVVKEPCDPGVKTFPIKSFFWLAEPLAAHFLGNSPAAARKFEKLAALQKPDVVHHHNVSLLGYKLFKKAAEYKNIYTAHDDWLARQSILQRWRKSAAFKKAVEELDAVISPSGYMKSRLEKATGKKIFLLPNFVPEPPSGNSSREKGLFLFVGVLEKSKGIMELLGAFKENDKKLAIAGTGSLEARIKKFISENKLSGRVSLLGWLGHSELYSLYRRAEALVIPSILPENCPLAALEAMSAGTPVLAREACGLVEISGKISNSLLFSESNLKQKIEEFKREDFPNVRDVFNENFSEKAFMRKYSGCLDAAV